MENKPSSLYMANPDVYCRRTTVGATLRNPDTGKSVAINSVGHMIWQALAQPRTKDEITAYLLDIYQEVPADQITQDVIDFLQALQPGGFVGEVWDEISPLPDTTAEGSPLSEESTLAPAPPEDETFHIYHGNSMLSTFRPGDYLSIEPVRVADVRPGDVVVYQGYSPDGTPTDVVHRVLAVRPGGLATRGDNNPQADKGLVTQETLLGRVTHMERGERVRGARVRKVSGGRWGLLQLRARRAWHRVRQLGWRLIRAVGRPAYRGLRESGLVARIWRPALIRLLVIDHKGKLVVKYAHDQRTVARWRPATGDFRCRRPYDLILRGPDED